MDRKDAEEEVEKVRYVFVVVIEFGPCCATMALGMSIVWMGIEGNRRGSVFNRIRVQ